MAFNWLLLCGMIFHYIVAFLMVLSGLYLNTIVVEEGCSTTKHLFDDVHPRSSTTLLGPIKENVPMILYFSRSFFLEE